MSVDSFDSASTKEPSNVILLEIGRNGLIEWMNEEAKSLFGAVRGESFFSLENKLTDCLKTEIIDRVFTEGALFSTTYNESQQISVTPVHTNDGGVERVVLSIAECEIAKVKLQSLQLKRELHLINKISKFMWEKDRSVSSLMIFLANELPNAMSYPDLASVKIICDGKEYLSPNFRETSLSSTYPIQSEKVDFGFITEYYDESSEMDPSELFNENEKSLFSTVAERAGEIVDRIKTSRTFFEVLESIGDGVVSTDMEGRIVFINNVAAKMIGKEESEAVGEQINKVLKLYDSETGRRILLDTKKMITAEGSKSFHPNAAIVSPAGTMRLLADSAEFVQDDDGEVIGIVHSFKDVTEERGFLKRLADNESRFRLLFDNMGMGVMICSVEGHAEKFILRDVNKAAERLEGVRREKLIGRDIVEAFPGSERFGLVEVFRKVYSSGEPAHIPATHCSDKTGSGWKEVSVFKLPSGEIVSLYQDVTQRRRYQTELEMQSHILNEVGKAIVATDSNREITFWNKAAEELYGWKSEEVIGKKASEVLMPEGNEKKANELFSSLLEKGIWKGIFSQKKRNGEIFIAEMTDLVVPVEDGKSRIFVNVSSDITEQKRTEETLKNTLRSTVEVLSVITESRSPFSVGHQKNVSRLASEIARKLGLGEERVGFVTLAGLMLDVGMIAVPSEILSKTGLLNDIERRLIEQHVVKGKEILEKADFFRPIIDQIYQHHERLDGSGYPRGLKGDEIILEARILAVADVFESMVSHRPQRPALGIEKALLELKSNAGTLYDPNVVKTCVLLIESGFTFDSN
ncbi:MAG: PAS domain S-box protein [Thermotogota bacterium]|nr:PAS domain S-box protein [Thermotogota bacterium]